MYRVAISYSPYLFNNNCSICSNWFFVSLLEVTYKLQFTLVFVNRLGYHTVSRDSSLIHFRNSSGPHVDFSNGCGDFLQQ